MRADQAPLGARFSSWMRVWMGGALLALPLALAPQAGLATTMADPAATGCTGAGWALEGGSAADPQSGLTWSRCSLGTVWSEDGCEGEVAQVSFAEASASAPAGWRLPSAEEIATLIDPDCGPLALDATVFPDIAALTALPELPYWTATREDLLGMRVYVDFALQMFDAHSEGVSLSARYLRAAP